MENDNNVEIREIKPTEFSVIWKEYFPKFFEERTQVIKIWDVVSESDLEIINKRQKNRCESINIYLGLYTGNKLIGWSWGYEDSTFKFYMCNSVIFPEYRNRGYYKILLNTMIEKATDLGFQEIFSRHTTTNNSVIIPKLKRGFRITSLEVSDLFGTLVTLTYFINHTRRKLLDYRVGQVKPDFEIKKLLKID